MQVEDTLGGLTFFFQGMFAATAATIVSGAVAERIKLKGFMLFYSYLCWIDLSNYWFMEMGWWIFRLWGFYDFAGSTLVHSVGGWAALMAVFTC